MRMNGSAWTLVMIWVLLVLPQSQAFNFRKRNCYDADKTLEALEKLAEIILTGRIESMEPEPNEFAQEVGVVKIKWVLKGAELASQKQNIRVHGFGDPHLCESSAVPRDTRIFMLHREGSHKYRLNSSLITVSLRNLEAVEAAIDGKSLDFWEIFRIVEEKFAIKMQIDAVRPSRPIRLVEGRASAEIYVSLSLQRMKHRKFYDS